MSTLLHPAVATARLGDLVDGIGKTLFSSPHRIAAVISSGLDVHLTLIDPQTGRESTLSARRHEDLNLTPPF